MIKDDKPALIPYDVYQALPKFHIEENDLLITVVGTLGKVAITIKKDITSIFSCKSTLIRVKRINPFYLLTYFNTDTGKLFSMRGKRGAIQEGLNLPDLEEIRVFIPSPKFQSKIEEIVKLSFDNKENSTALYQQAQDILLAELGLNNWKPAHRLTFVKRYSDTQQAKRMDAEYFQPKYDDIIDAIKAYKGGYSTIRAEFKQNKTTFKVDSEKLYQYVEIGSINVSNGEISPSEVLGSELPANAKRALNKNDVIVSKVRTYRGAITIVEKDGYVGSGALTTLTEDGSVNKETLLAFLHSKPLLAWSLKPNTGTSYPVIVDEDILNLPIPVLSQSKQQDIQQKIVESFVLRKKSKRLLEAAKRTVDIVIEQGETAAMQWLESQ